MEGMNLYYILDGKEVKEAADVIEWGKWFGNIQNRIVKQTELTDGIKVSTVFLGLDHGFGGSPQLFETMVFGGEHDGYQERYGTWDEAEKGHQETIEMIYS